MCGSVLQNGGVTTEYSGSGDPARSMELLWGGRAAGPRRGPRPRLTVEAITRAAVEVADAEGLAALSMRRVAERLGVAAMSLYTYVPGKAELLDLMVDAVGGETARPAGSPAAGGTGWSRSRGRTGRCTGGIPGSCTWRSTRPALGPNMLAKYDYELGAVEGVGLTDVEMDSVLTLVLGHVTGAARGLVDAQRPSGVPG